MARVVVVGAGPIGLYSAIMLARAGNNVVVVDRDPGPQNGTWQAPVSCSSGTHFFRHLVRQALLDTAPDLWGCAGRGRRRPMPAARPAGGYDESAGRRSTLKRHCGPARPSSSGCHSAPDTRIASSPSAAA